MPPQNSTDLPLVDIEVSVESAKHMLQTDDVRAALDSLEATKEVSHDTLLFVFSV
jgi:hypothetical protein